MPTRSRFRAIVWILAAIAIPWALFEASLSSDFYNLTSPPEFGLHILLRKIYSVGAFALVGYLVSRAIAECSRPLAPQTVIMLGAVYSGAIEMAQYYVGSQEGIWWNLFDIGCGAVGGAVAARIPGGSKPALVKPAVRPKRPRGFVNSRNVPMRNVASNKTSRKSKITGPRR